MSKTKKHSDAEWNAKAGSRSGWTEKNLGLLGGSGADSTRFERRSRNVGRLAEAVMLRLEQQKVGMEPPPAQIRQAAQAGISGAGGPLPHQKAIQQSFGHHDISGVRAHVGGAAAQASEAIGAEAYATGNDVAFKSAPSLHTAAHEAAHVVQQRSGKVQLKGGVGQVGDIYEQHADAVADLVVQGKSAAPLLDRFTGQSKEGGSVQTKAVQMEKAQGESKEQAAPDIDQASEAKGEKASAPNAGEGKTGDEKGAQEKIDPAVRQKVMAAAKNLKGYRVQLVPTDDPKEPQVIITNYLDGTQTAPMKVDNFLDKIASIVAREKAEREKAEREKAEQEEGEKIDPAVRQKVMAVARNLKGYRVQLVPTDDPKEPQVIITNYLDGTQTAPLSVGEFEAKVDALAQGESDAVDCEERAQDPETEDGECEGTAQTFRGYKLRVKSGEGEDNPIVILVHPTSGVYSKPLRMEELETNFDAVKSELDYVSTCLGKGEHIPDGTHFTYVDYKMQVESDEKGLAKATIRYDLRPIEGVIKTLVPGIGWVNITLSLNANVLVSSTGPIDLNNTFRPLAKDIAQDVKSQFGAVQLRVSQDKMSINIAPANPLDIALRFEAGAKGWACTGTSGNHKLNLPKIEGDYATATGAIWAQVKISQDWTQSQAPGLLGAYAAARAANAAYDTMEQWAMNQDHDELRRWLFAGTGVAVVSLFVAGAVASFEVAAIGSMLAEKAAEAAAVALPALAPVVAK